jgi:hypothetical protein
MKKTIKVVAVAAVIAAVMGFSAADALTQWGTGGGYYPQQGAWIGLGWGGYGYGNNGLNFGHGPASGAMFSGSSDYSFGAGAGLDASLRGGIGFKLPGMSAFQFNW